MSNLFDPAYRIHPITWNMKHYANNFGTNSRADDIAVCLIASTIKDHPIAEISGMIQKYCFEQIRRADKWIIK